jgi:hypothetical protein
VFPVRYKLDLYIYIYIYIIWKKFSLQRDKGDYFRHIRVGKITITLILSKKLSDSVDWMCKDRFQWRSLES